MKRINLASLILGLIVLNGGNIANAATCGSVSLTPSDSPQNTGTVDCVAYGPGNLELNDDNELVLTDSIEYGSLNGLPGVLTPVSGISFDDNSGEFTILNTVWSDWSSIFIGIKEANGQAGGGWGLFSLTEAILDGSFATKLQARHSGTGFSHYFAIGGDPGPAPDPVPVPAAVWLFGSGLLGLIGAARRKSAAA